MSDGDTLPSSPFGPDARTPRSYAALVEVAYDLSEYDGYIDLPRLKRKNRLQGQFNFARDTLLDSLIKSERDWRRVTERVSANLDIAAEECGPGWADAVERTREMLLSQIERERRRSPFEKALVSWAPFVVTALAVLAFWLFARA